MTNVEKDIVYEVLETALPDLQQMIEKLNKRAAKLKLPTLSFTIVSEFFKTFKVQTIYQTEADIVIKILRVKVDGLIPVINGYEFIAKLEHLTSGNLVKQSVPREIPEHFRSIASNCDHCHTKHSRKYTYVIRNVETNEFLQIGTSCIDDYLRSTSINVYIDLINSLSSLLVSAKDDDIYLEKCHSMKYFKTNDFLAHVLKAVDVFHEFKTKSKCEPGDEPTFVHALFSIKPLLGRNTELYQSLQPNEKDLKKAQEIISKVLENFSAIDNKSEFQHNLFVLLNEEYVAEKDTPLLSTVYLAYLRIIENELKEKIVFLNEYYGNIGDKITIELTVTNIIAINSYYGSSYLYIFLDKDNRKFIWKSSSFKEKLEENNGLFYKIKGTIKDHEEYRGSKQTVLTRCSIVS